VTIFRSIATRPFKLALCLSIFLAICTGVSSAQYGPVGTTVGDIYNFIGPQTFYHPGYQGAATGLAFDSSNNMYACANDGTVKKITQQGVVTIYAGGGTSLGNGSAPTNEEIYDCFALAFDPSGNLYIATEDNVWVVNPSGTTINNFAGIATPPVGPTTNCPLSATSATSAYLGLVNGLAADASGVYISSADPMCMRIFKVVGGMISTYAGTTSTGYNGDNQLAVNATLNYPTGLALDLAGNLYIADSLNYRVRVIVKSTGYIYTYAGTGSPSYTGQGSGSATLVPIGGVQDVKFDYKGNLFISDLADNVIREVVPSTSGGAVPSGTMQPYAGTGYEATGTTNCGSNDWYVQSQDGAPALQANLTCPWGVATDSFGNVYISDFSAFRIREVVAPQPSCDTSGTICTVAGNGTAGFNGDGPALSAELNNPLGLYVDGSNNIFVADSYNNRVREFTVGEAYRPLREMGPAGAAYPMMAMEAKR
jgi:hypothetical protein